MNKTKYLISFASVGFVFSFIIGLFSSVPFGIILLRALISALVMACVYFAGSVVFEKFLDEGGMSVSSTPTKPKTSGKVDTALDDTLIFDDENGPEFRIPKQLINESIPVAKPQPEKSAESTASSAQNDATERVQTSKPVADVSPAKQETSTENFARIGR